MRQHYFVYYKWKRKGGNWNDAQILVNVHPLEWQIKANKDHEATYLVVNWIPISPSEYELYR